MREASARASESRPVSALSQSKRAWRGLATPHDAWWPGLALRLPRLPPRRQVLARGSHNSALVVAFGARLRRNSPPDRVAIP